MECPYCETEMEETDYLCDSKDGVMYDTECPQCEKTFGYTIEIEYSVNTQKIPCKNGECKCEWKIIKCMNWQGQDTWYCIHCQTEKKFPEGINPNEG